MKKYRFLKATEKRYEKKYIIAKNSVWKVTWNIVILIVNTQSKAI